MSDVDTSILFQYFSQRAANDALEPIHTQDDVDIHVGPVQLLRQTTSDNIVDASIEIGLLMFYFYDVGRRAVCEWALSR